MCCVLGVTVCFAVGGRGIGGGVDIRCWHVSDGEVKRQQRTKMAGMTEQGGAGVKEQVLPKGVASR
jgi:hypothetical protein